MTQIGAIFWAQWRTLYHFHPRRGAAWSAMVSFIWYGLWSAIAVVLLRVFSNPAQISTIRIALPGGLLLIFLYWQVVPLILATTGSSLDLRKLRAYPIPDRPSSSRSKFCCVSPPVSRWFCFWSALPSERC